MLMVCCPLLAALEMRQCRMFPIASRMCSRPLAYRLQCDARCLLPVVWRLLRGVSRMTHVPLLSLAMFRVVRCTLSVVFSTLFVVCCMLQAACCTLDATLRVARRCCMAHVV
jgi:hypothetical protein